MIMFYLVILILAGVLLAIPSTRRVLVNPIAAFRGRMDGAQARQRAADAARSASDAARGGSEAARSVGEAARGAGEAARGAGEAAIARRSGSQLDRLAETVVIDAPVDAVASLLVTAMEEAAVVDPATPRTGESLAWTYSSLTETRFAATAAAPGETVFGVVSFEYLDGSPQGVSVAERVMDKARTHLTEAAVPFRSAVRTFEPGREATDDGPRAARPLT